MPHAVLDSLALGYQLLWNQRRQVCGVQLFLEPQEGVAVSAQDLRVALEPFGFRPALPLLLSVSSAPLLAELLAQAPMEGVWLGLSELALQDPTLLRRAYQASQRGVALFWQGSPGARAPGALAPCLNRSMLTLSPQEALSCLRVSLRKPLGAGAQGQASAVSPVLSGQIYEAVPSGLLAGHCLDERQAWALAGWPMEEVLHGYRHQRIQPAQRTLNQLLEQVSADGPNDTLIQLLCLDPILAYRLLRFANSAALGLRTEVESLHQALLLIGRVQLRAWLQEQLPHASSDLNLHPVRTAMALRAQLMAALLDPSESEEVRSEVLLCGLLSQIDLLLGEPLPAVLGRLPVPARITEALLEHAGPYLPFLEVACALEHTDTQACAARCAAHRLRPEAVNRALLQSLSQLGVHPLSQQRLS